MQHFVPGRPNLVPRWSNGFKLQRFATRRTIKLKLSSLEVSTIVVQAFENDDLGYRARLRLGPTYVGNGPWIHRLIVHRSDCKVLNKRKPGQVRDTSYRK